MVLRIDAAGSATPVPLPLVTADRACEATSAPAQSSVLHSVNVAITLSQALRSAEAISRAITHA